VQDFDGDAPEVGGLYRGTATSDGGVAHDFALDIEGQDHGNFEGGASAPNTTGDPLLFDFDGRIDDKGHASVVGLGPAGTFFVEAQFESGEGGKTFSGEYMIIFADGSIEQGTLDLSMTQIIGDTTGVSPGA